MTEPQTRPLGQQMLRAFGLFQILTTLPTMLILGFCAWEQLFFTYGGYYYFLYGPLNMPLLFPPRAPTTYLNSAESMTALMAAGITFIVYVQRKALVTTFQTLLFESIKSTLATGLWLWLILDSAFGPWKYHRYEHVPQEEVDRRVKRAALSILLMIVFFYPPLGYAYMVWRANGGIEELSAGSEERSDRAERTPLLAQESDRAERTPLLAQESGRTLG
ncbi:hypothetical protein EJ02DRAFT_423665 [Clathrospora elynae]|uniref:Uncharacterized protein n=1 Tax=Clathrospora elynae TaxID=706981 RepID=A0A6A5SMA3_9PLEO|nr:hypothetical protein EJ02DRAFT_423665 [Clathrospora elynae]